MRETGIVKSVEKNKCTISVVRKTACGENCATCSGACKAKTQLCVAQNDAFAQVGDTVAIEMDSGKVIKSAFLVYMLPLIIFVACYYLVLSITKNQVAAAILSVIAMALLFVFLRRFDKRNSEEYNIHVTEIIKRS